MSKHTCSFKIFNKVQNIDNEDDTSSFSKLSAAIFASKMWDQDEYPEIFYGFLEDPSQVEIDNRHTGPNIDPLQRVINDNIEDNIEIDIKEEIKKVANTINKFIGIKLKFVEPDIPAHIRIGFDVNDGCWSMLGTDILLESPKGKEMNFAWFNIATVFHEFFHALGMVHEHQNPNNNPLDWDIDAIYADFNRPENPNKWDIKTINHNIIDAYSSDQVNSTSFDKDSIMLYWFPKSYTHNNVEVSQNFRISPKDVYFLNYTYPIDGKSQREVVTTFFKEHFDQEIDYDNLKININKSDFIPELLDDPIPAFRKHIEQPTIKFIIKNYKNIIICVSVLLVLYILYKILKK